MRLGTERLALATVTSLLLGSAACTDSGRDRPGAGESTVAARVEANELFRAPAIPNVIDGVTWEPGNWEPHLGAGEKGVSWGNHRAVVEVAGEEPVAAEETAVADSGSTQIADAVMVTIPWRRRDADPESKGVIVVDASTGEVVPNALAARIENVSGDVIFQPNPGSSTYHIYYLPWQSTGGYYPTMTYPTPDQLRAAARDSRGVATAAGESVSRAEEAGASEISWVGLVPNPDPEWEQAVRAGLPDEFVKATPTHIQSVNEFHSFFPMEVIASPEEEAAFLAAALGTEEGGSPGFSPGATQDQSEGQSENEGQGENQDGDPNWALALEHRDYPIRMRHFLPRHWVDRTAVSLMPANTDVSAETREGETSTQEHVSQTDVSPLSTLRSQVLRDEAFAFQVAVIPGFEPLDDLSVTFEGFPASWTETLTCLNCGGIDENGFPFTKDLHVSAATLQPLWIGVRVPEDQRPGLIEGTVTVHSSNRGSRTALVSLDVQGGTAINGGANEPELQTRLAWFNSTVGSDPDFIIEPFEPVRIESLIQNSAGGDSAEGESAEREPIEEEPVGGEPAGGEAEGEQPAGQPVHALSILGRRVELGSWGLPTQIYSYFTPELTQLAEEPEPILAQPLTLQVISPGTFLEAFHPSSYEVRQEAAGRAQWTAESTSDYFDMTVDGTLEYDGMLDLRITLVALSDASFDDIRLPVSLVPDAAEYMLGLGQKGGKRPPFVDWKWAVENHQEGVWLGGVHKGLQYVLRDNNYVRPLNTNFYQNQPLNMPPSWFNGGLGGIVIGEELLEGAAADIRGDSTATPDGDRAPGDTQTSQTEPIGVTAINYSGPRSVLENDTLHFNIRFLITPFKPIDTQAHFNTRFVHQYVPVDSVRAWGGTVVNIHHANEINPYINYPFFNLEQQAAYIDEAHEKGIKVKLYNTIRELTYKAHELFAMRSLGDEILNDGEGGGHSWMQEHLEGDYHSAWHAARTDDAAMLNKGTSRWTNYYIEGINWLAANQHIDGLYLDDIAFSRETVKRMVTVLDQNRPEVVIDLHSANQFNPRDGFTNSAMLYMEHFPFISRLWFGEYFEYDLDQDYWMTEVAGLPFGLMGEMLQDGGHPYRGMLYGMTARKYGNVDPRPVWEMMNDFGIAESRMLGYWLEDAPVTTNNSQVLATTYVRPEAILIALASWSDEDEVVELTVDWESLGWPRSGQEERSDPESGGRAPEGSGSGYGDGESGDPGSRTPGSLDDSAMSEASAPAVAGLQDEAMLDLRAVSVPAGQGLFVLLRQRTEGEG